MRQLWERQGHGAGMPEVPGSFREAAMLPVRTNKCPSLKRDNRTGGRPLKSLEEVDKKQEAIFFGCDF